MINKNHVHVLSGACRVGFVLPVVSVGANHFGDLYYRTASWLLQAQL